MFGSYGSGLGKLEHPICVGIDSDDRVYIGDINDRVSVFSFGGQYITSFGRSGERAGEFKYPSGLAIDTNGVVYVCDRDNNRILLF